jgi:hypothetical protein
MLSAASTIDVSPSQFRWPPEGVIRAPYRLFTDRDIYQLEQQRIFRGRSWNFLGLDVEIPNVGDCKTASVGQTPVVVTRGNMRWSTVARTKVHWSNGVLTMADTTRKLTSRPPPRASAAVLLTREMAPRRNAISELYGNEKLMPGSHLSATPGSVTSGRTGVRVSGTHIRSG